MILEHIAIWTDDLEGLKNFYITYFEGFSNERYTNEKNHFHRYFISFKSGARLELMTKPDLPHNANDTIVKQHIGLIHFAFGITTKEGVDNKANQLIAAGFTILKGPCITGDGYYEFETLDPDNNRLEVIVKV